MEEGSTAKTTSSTWSQLQFQAKKEKEDSCRGSHKETKGLLSILSDKRVHAKLRTSNRRRFVYREMAEVMADNGFNRSWFNPGLLKKKKLKEMKSKFKITPPTCIKKGKESKLKKWYWRT